MTELARQGKLDPTIGRDEGGFGRYLCGHDVYSHAAIRDSTNDPE